MGKTQAVTLHLGDCLDVMRGMEDASVDAVVTDPPYGLGFMGRAWDHGVPGVPFWEQVARVAKPGAHLLAFGGTRTFHRLMVAIEDAGWEMRDTIMWVYGQGFPKSHNLDGEWQGWGTALKPAWEPIIVARKRPEGTVAGNVQKWGTGAINVDGCRVGTESTIRTSNAGTNGEGWGMGKNDHLNGSEAGRWPANLIHDGSEEVVGLFPQTGPSKATNRGLRHSGRHGGIADTGANIKEGTDGIRGHNDIGGSAARFFYCAKASGKDRDAGVAGVAGVAGGMKGRNDGSMGSITMRKNVHPTVKPTALMRYLCRLVTPPGGTVLDPFMGSGTTGKAAVLEGFRFIGIEREAEYLEIARARIAAAQGGCSVEPVRPADESVAAPPALDLFGWQEASG